MNCQEFRSKLDDWLDGREAENADLRAHVEDCAACAEQLAIERRFRAQLRTLAADVPEGDAARNERLLAPLRAGSGHSHRRQIGIAAAACLMVGIAIGVLWSPWGSQPQSLSAMEAVVLDANVTQSVKLAFRSPGDLQNAEIRLQASDNVEIAGYPGQRELRWHADLSRGTNMLELPVRLLGAEGRVVATISYRGGSRSFSVNLRARAMDGAELEHQDAMPIPAQAAYQPHSDRYV